MNEWRAFMTKWYPEGDKDDGATVFGYGVAQAHRAGAETVRGRPHPRERHEAGRQSEISRSESMLPGIRIKTSPDRFRPDRAAADDAVQGRELGAVRPDHERREELVRGSLAVIASEAKQSILAARKHGLLRRFAPRKDVGELYFPPSFPRRRRVSLLLRILVRLLLRRLQVARDLLQGCSEPSARRSAGWRHRASADGRRELGDRLLQEIDIALQAGGAPLHGLFDGADFDAGNILRKRSQATAPSGSRKPQDAIVIFRAIIEILIQKAMNARGAPITANCASGPPAARDTTLIPHSGVVFASVTREDGFSRRTQTDARRRTLRL